MKNSIRHILEFVVELVVFACIILLASIIFKGVSISSFWYALLTSLVITLLNMSVKPFLVLITLPITISSLGIFYPIVNVIVLYITSWIMGSNFVLGGFFSTFFVAIFISFMKLILNSLIVEPIKRG